MTGKKTGDETEPLPATSRRLTLPNVTLTSHAAYKRAPPRLGCA